MTTDKLDGIKDAALKLGEVIAGSPYPPISVAEYNAWMARLVKAHGLLVSSILPQKVSDDDARNQNPAPDENRSVHVRV